MSTTVEVLESIVKFGGHQQVVRFLKSCDESRVFSSEIEEARAAIAVTNRLLNETSTRRDGLLVLKCLLGQIPSDLLQANIFPWLQQALKGLSQKESSSTVTVAAEVINVLLPLSSKFPEIRKQIALNTISKMLEVLCGLKDSSEFIQVVLPCLQTVSKHYNKSASHWKETFDKFVLGLIEEDEATVRQATRCYLALAACGPPGTDMMNYKENWALQFRSLSSALHLVLDRLFENVNEIEQFSCESRRLKPIFEVPVVEAKLPYVRLSRLATQFVNLSEYMNAMLLGPFPVGKRVVPEQLLSVACRGLAITVQTLKAQVTSDTLGLIAQIPQIHTSCLSLLRSLIISCRTNLINYGPVISKLISQVLKSTETTRSAYGQHKPYRSVRAAAYDCLTCWLTVASCSSGVDKHPEIIDNIISDVLFKKPSVKLNITSKILKGKMGKKQRQALVNQTISNKEEYVADREANSEVCLAALHSVPPLLESVSSLLSPQNHKDLQTAVCTELLITQLNSGEQIPLPYSDKYCRLALYKSFVAMCHNFHPSFPPPLSFASQLISGGTSDPFDGIVRLCTQSLSSVDKMLRPIGPTLSFPLEFPEMVFMPKKYNLKPADQPISTPQNESGKSLESSQSTVLDGSVSLTVNGASRDDVASVSELEPNPLLVDAEMSEFDYTTVPKSPLKPIVLDTNSGTSSSFSAPNDQIVDLASSDSSQQSVTVISDSPKQNEVSSRLVERQNGRTSPKRKPEIVAESQQSAKKIKTSIATDNEPSVVLSSDEDPMADRDTSDGSSAPANKGADTENAGNTLLPDDDVEEAMLSSFVDEVN